MISQLKADFILRGVNEKNPEGWRALFEHYYSQLCFYVERLLNDATEAEDCIQNVMLYMWDCKKIFQTLDDLTYFLYRVAHNQAMMRLRAKKCREYHHQKILSDAEVADDDLFASIVWDEIVKQMYQHIEQLPSEQAKVMQLCIEGNSNQEIADRLGISINTVKTHKSRSFKFLRGKMQKWKSALLWFFLTLYEHHGQTQKTK